MKCYQHNEQSCIIVVELLFFMYLCTLVPPPSTPLLPYSSTPLLLTLNSKL